MNQEFLVDINLPKYFRYFNTPNFHFVADINTRLSDEQVWNLALAKGYTILTKDTDFSIALWLLT